MKMFIKKGKQTELKKDMEIQYSLEKLKHICLSLFIGFVSVIFCVHHPKQYQR